MTKHGHLALNLHEGEALRRAFAMIERSRQNGGDAILAEGIAELFTMADERGKAADEYYERWMRSYSV